MVNNMSLQILYLRSSNVNDKVNIYIHESMPQCNIHHDSVVRLSSDETRCVCLQAKKRVGCKNLPLGLLF